MNHISAASISPYIPPFLGTLIFGSGTIGVSFLFILSGFLMAYIYPHPPSPMHFLQKRYTRIFPLFLTMVSVMLIYRVFSPPWFVIFPVTILLACIVHVFWVRGAKPHFSARTKRSVFILFLILQVLVGAFYMLWIMRHPPVVFNQEFPLWLRETTIGLVNGTLTLPLGNYIPMLDGVYWSLAGEVLFYILYPILCVPIIWCIAPKKRWIKVLFLLSLIPLFVGIDIVSHQSLLLSLLQISYCFYFVTGMALGYLYRHQPLLFQTLKAKLPFSPISTSIISFALIPVFLAYVKFHVSSIYHPAINILWAFPITFLIAIALDQTTNIAKIFRSRILVFLGTISYSVYLSHTLVIDMLEKSIPSTTTLLDLLSIVLTFMIAVPFSVLLYRLLERPYFQRDKAKKEEVTALHGRWITVIRNPKLLLSGITLLYALSVLAGYQSNFNLLSLQYGLGREIFVNPKVSGNSLSMDKYPRVSIEVTPRMDNFKAITMHLTRKTKKSLIGARQELIFRLREHGSTMWLATNTYHVGEIGDSYYHPFGFPTIPNSKGRTYDIELSMGTPNDSEYIQLDTSPGATKSIYQVTKPQLLQKPHLLAQVLQQRAANILGNLQARLALLLALPFILCSTLLILKPKTP